MEDSNIIEHTLDTTGRTSSNSLGPVFTEEIGNSYHEEQETYFEEPLSVVLSSSPSSSSYIEQLESSRGAEQVIETPKLTGSENNDTDYTSAKLQQKVRSTSYGATVVKKRKGGWPKGKKRKKETEETLVKTPLAPSTGYVIFLSERRQQMKETHPHISFGEVTKILGNEWSCLSSKEKQNFLDRAEEDKKRYCAELKEYQQSEAYQTYLKQKKLKNVFYCNGDRNKSLFEQENSSSFIIQDIEEEDTNELYCKVCDQFFVSLHNKKEHLYGRQHLQAITGEIHRELAPRLQGVENGDCQSVGEGFSDDSYNGCSSSGKTADISLHKNWVSNVNQAIIDFMNVTHAREKEIVVLSQHLENVKHTNLEFQQKLEELKKMMETAHRSLQDLKTEGTFLSTQLDQLRMVPALFGVINF